jgi:type II secretory pathway component PulF
MRTTASSLRPERRPPHLRHWREPVCGEEARADHLHAAIGTLLESGVPVMRCLELLEEQASSAIPGIGGISKTIRGGSSFRTPCGSIRPFPPPTREWWSWASARQDRGDAAQIATYLEREDQIAKRALRLWPTRRS